MKQKKKMIKYNNNIIYYMKDQIYCKTNLNIILSNYTILNQIIY